MRNPFPYAENPPPPAAPEWTVERIKTYDLALRDLRHEAIKSFEFLFLTAQAVLAESDKWQGREAKSAQVIFH